MRKPIFLVLCIALILVGCKGKISDNTEDSKGVYYQKIDEKEIGQRYNALASYAYGLLHYDDKMYTSALHYSSTEKSTLNLDSILGEEIETVLGNHGVFWSTEGEELSEVTYEGRIYQIKGYDEAFRIGIYYETSMPLADTYYHLIIFEHLNDVTLHKGSELFDDRLHLSEAVWVEGAMEEKDLQCQLSAEDTTVKEFLAALYEGTFLDPAEEAYPTLDSAHAYTLSFYDPIGLFTNIMVYKEGYVSMEQAGEKALILKADAQKCKNIIEKITQS